eukprot:11258881-Ditylum_brightwellii.AAC.1
MANAELRIWEADFRVMDLIKATITSSLFGRYEIGAHRAIEKGDNLFMHGCFGFAGGQVSLCKRDTSLHRLGCHGRSGATA